MTAFWEPGTYYSLDSIVEHEGHRYKVIQPHTSQPDWTPPTVPALWGRMEETYRDEGYSPSYAPAYSQPPPAQGGGEKRWDEHTEQRVPIHEEEHKKNWWDLDAQRKKELEIGGGLLAGLALIGGGYLAYHEHEKNEEEKKALTWQLQGWLREAQARTQRYHQLGPEGPVSWILVEGKTIPSGAIPGGEERGQPLYICRAFHDGSIRAYPAARAHARADCLCVCVFAEVGKASSVFQHGAVIGYAHKEIHVRPSLCVLRRHARATLGGRAGHLNLGRLGARPVEGGREADGTPLYVAQAHHHNAIHPGKASEKLGGAFIPFDGTEKSVEDYRVLCYAQ
ncbi:hypothetical protein A0H81_11214 [Grifola frondosa]|uniref:Chitin-binding type-3 domain-containing protein n=1 Tax=Grifola frondosa TaxID=5627 RepID=A0A1C7M1V5_GRIFR|nr:hypothetical protein A0H81_11214 [Grifola frondosa]